MNHAFRLALTRSTLKALAALPYGLVARTGSALGSALYQLPSRRKRIVHTNLRLCFPELTDAEREALARDTFRHVIRSYLERGLQWCGSARQLQQRTTLNSAIPLRDSYEQPTIFMGFHFAAIEAACMVYSSMHPVASIYTPMSSPVAEQISLAQRSRFGTEMIARGGSAREILRVLKSGKPIMLAADMDFGPRDSVFVPFFGVPALTLTSVSRLARLSGARVVPFVADVLPGYKGYHVEIFDALPGYPSGDDAADAATMNRFLEEQIRLRPAQYYWVHRRFKRRPPGKPRVY